MQQQDPFFKWNIQNSNQQQNINKNIQNNQNQNYFNNQNQQQYQNTQNNNQQQINKQQQIQQILQQEQYIQQQIFKFNNILKTQKLNPVQQQQVARQLQQLNFQLQNIYRQKQAMWIIKTTKPILTKKNKWKKVSAKSILLWCSILLIVLLWWLALVFYSFIQNPSKLTSMWLSVQTTKQLLQTFISVAFGLLTFLWFWMFVSNIYRIFTAKHKSKIWYIVWSFIWIWLFIVSISFWMKLMWSISKIVPTNITNSNSVLIPYNQFKEWTVLIDKNIQLIAPNLVYFRLNSNIFNSKILSKLWSIDNQNLWISLNCWNEKNTIVNYNLKNQSFQWGCFYSSKWKYQITLIVNYINPQTQEKLEKTFDAWNIDIKSQINISKWNNSEQIIVWKNELILWKVPQKIYFDANDVFKDFSLKDYKIIWDLDWDWKTDNENSTNLTYFYKKAKVYNVNFRIPELNDHLYTFQVRAEQSDVPVCELNYKFLKWSEYSFTTNFIENNEIINDYIYDIYDKNTKKIIKTIKTNDSFFKYSFPWEWSYFINVKFQTKNWKEWKCESDNINVWKSDFDISYEILYKNAWTDKFISFKKDINNDTYEKDWIIYVKKLPVFFKTNILSINPETSNAKKTMYINDKKILSNDENSYDFTVDENKDYTVKIVVEDKQKEMKTEKTFYIKVKRDDIIGNISVFPKTVWTDPFSVKFDASSSKVNDKDDEIVYFSRDFWDWESKKNISQAVINHTYKYDYKKENWTYNPKLTLTTKKWRTLEVLLDNPIIVKKQQKTFKINIDSHPWQLARIWDIVKFSLELNWLPEKIHWNFWNWNEFECKWRECIETTQIYKKKWTYTISVKIYDKNNSSTENSINIKIQ